MIHLLIEKSSRYLFDNQFVMKKVYLHYILRNIKRKRNQSLFSFLCICISSVIILGNMALNNGIQYKLKKGVNEAISGQWTIYKSNHKKLNILEAQLNEQSKFDWNKKKNKQLLAVSPDIIINKRIRFGSLISLKDETSWVNIQALEQDHLNRLKSLIHIHSGVIPKGNHILLSETTADELHCSIGDSVLLLANNTNDYLSDEIALVSGIFEENGLALFFSYNAFIPYQMGKNIVQLEDNESLELIVNSKTNTDLTNQEIQTIKEYLDVWPSHLTMTPWNKTIPLFYAVIKVWQGCGYFIQFTFVLFSLVILISLISLIVYSRKKEFGTLLALGFSWKRITLMISTEYLILCCFSVLTSYLLTLFFLSFFPDTGIYISSKDMQSALLTEYMLPILYLKNFIYVLSLFAITTLFAVLISISRIKKTNPVKLINNE